MPVRVLARLFRRLFLQRLTRAHKTGALKLHGALEPLKSKAGLKAYLAPLARANWVVYAKPPFGGPDQVLAYLSRYTHRVAISNSRLVTCDGEGIRFRYKDYRQSGRDRFKTMTLEPAEFIRRFLQHVLPKGFHRIRHFGLFANGHRARKIARIRSLMTNADSHGAEPDKDSQAGANQNRRDKPTAVPCPCCGGVMLPIFEWKAAPRRACWPDTS